MFDSIVNGTNMPPMSISDSNPDISTGFGGEYSGLSKTGYCSASSSIADTDSRA